jgi:nitrite reductase (NADH) small subunit
MPSWITVCRTDDCPRDAVREFTVQGRIVAIACYQDEYYAMDGICPHQGGPLGKGTVEKCVLTCPWHGWQFQIRSGQSLLSPHIVQPVFPLRCVNGEIQIEWRRE